jgi:hypothetical protein
VNKVPDQLAKQMTLLEMPLFAVMATPQPIQNAWIGHKKLAK